jgi:hypothetical protein
VADKAVVFTTWGVKMQKYLNVLKKLSLFEGISEENLSALLSCLNAKTVHYEKNRYVYISGESFEGMG